MKYPGVIETVNQWITINGCQQNSLVQSGEAFNLEQSIFGDETVPYSATCPQDVDVSLWKV
jgi:hypothetical protein